MKEAKFTGVFDLAPRATDDRLLIKTQQSVKHRDVSRFRFRYLKRLGKQLLSVLMHLYYSSLLLTQDFIPMVGEVSHVTAR
jgi:hypothetical protein